MAEADTPEDPQQPLTSSSMSDPLNNPYGSLNDLCYELSSLQDLASRGSWRSILDKVSRARKLSLLTKPHEHLTYLTYNALALTKLRRIADALAELDSLDEDLDSPNYRYEYYPEQYPNRSGSMVPFGLRWLHAELPAKLGKRNETLDRFYMLLHFVRKKLADKSSNNSSAYFNNLFLVPKLRGCLFFSLLSAKHRVLVCFEFCSLLESKTVVSQRKFESRQLIFDANLSI